MANEQYKDQKKPLAYSKGEIERAADSIRHGVQGDERNVAISKIQNFREFHLYPLMLLKNHLVRTANKVNKKIIVARRLKRLPTIINKLERPTLDGQGANSIRITSMQDIAGCRAIVKNTKQLFELKKRLESSRSVHKIIRTRDYLVQPKESGYGGLHLIYSCYEEQEEHHTWNKAKVEIQLRTELQHSWATSLEIIDTLTGIELKTSHDGHEKWRRYFSLAGQLVAHHEQLCTITQDELEKLCLELKQLETELHVLTKLAQYSLAINFTTGTQVPKKALNSNCMFLVEMMRDGHKHPYENEAKKVMKMKVSITRFSSKQSDTALKALNESELNESVVLSVLLSAPDIRMLKKAYPNYFGSTHQFGNFIKSYISNIPV
ncbi:GTP pyrophosphokinase [Vibrio cholerae]|nr:GTP pyrophosphokinase [Vibrio cholerae]EGR4299625.1 GTP pyrophosphokinase [Vibrio cholerae]